MSKITKKQRQTFSSNHDFQWNLVNPKYILQIYFAFENNFCFYLAPGPWKVKMFWEFFLKIFCRKLMGNCLKVLFYEGLKSFKLCSKWEYNLVLTRRRAYISTYNVFCRCKTITCTKVKVWKPKHFKHKNIFWLSLEKKIYF